MARHEHAPKRGTVSLIVPDSIAYVTSPFRA